jgi:lipid A 4'-phosphatase
MGHGMRIGIGAFAGSSRSIDAPELLQWSSAAFVVSLILFMGFDDLDIGMAGLFFHDGRFVGRQAAVEAVRDALKLVYITGLVCAVAGVWFCYVRKQNLLRLSGARWLVVLATLIVGPGLVANVLLKDQMGRARPSQTEIFGGTKAFTPPLVATNQCEKNCSFVSGEASSLFAMFFGLAMVAGPRARALIAVGIAVGSFAGLIRMSQGAHFLSDVVFAAIFMAITAALMRILIMDVQRIWHAERAVDVHADGH